jgi:dolichol-phosphate mannosyltransferase
VLLIDNGSTDGSSRICESFAFKNTNYKYIQFTRNFGIEASFYAGTTYANGDALIYLFSDLQDPPELIPAFIEKWTEGFDIVYGKLIRRKDHTVWKTIGAFIAYRMIYILSNVKIPINATDFRLLSRKVINAVNDCKETNRYMRGLVHWTGFSQCPIPFERSPRIHGKSSAGVFWSIKYAFSAVFSFSEKPLKIASAVGVTSFFISFSGAVFWIAATIMSRKGMIDFTPPPLGWTTMALLIFFFGGIQCLFIGILGEYIASLHQESKKRSPWVIQKVIGLELNEK